ncbi:motility-associated protein Scm1 [Spiroplasma tabanidicola]|uniref:Motility-associated protein Scm1 n=1 Tax=Spiroplasma tabanidicola TaxID=324079 RepID=A0A6I6CCB8_9MOLU|nr:motility-associated protein Scm1 [Spiroplasma tabanidicola]QGS51908.1 motility-associated protein Scm1 [Spiroplasma tabanidicola]
MKNKIFTSLFISTAAFFLILLIVSLVILPSFNVNNELNRISAVDSSDQGLKDYLNGVRPQIKNKLDLAYMIMGLEGLATMLKIHSFGAVTFTILVAFFLPLVGTMLGMSFLVFIFLFVISRIKREYKFNTIRLVGKIGLLVSSILFLIMGICGIVLFSDIETFLNKNNGEVSNYLNKINNNDSHNAFAFITAYKYFTNGKLQTLINNGLSQTGLYFGDLPINNIEFKAAISIGTIMMPLFGIFTIFFASIWIATFISNRNNQNSKFSYWLKNVRIDSKKEFRRSLLTNVWFWISLITFTITIIFPGFIHPYKTLAQTLLTVINAILLPICFIPIIYAWFKIIKIKRFNYNKMMFNQILIFCILVMLNQILIWVLFREEMGMPVWIGITWPFVAIILSIVCLFGFVHQKH